MDKTRELQQQLGLFDVFSVTSGAMISSGLFVLPAILYDDAGPAIIISYLLAALLILPSVLSKAELTTAMPRSGGTYFYVERSFGSLWGIFTGLANWFSLALKSAFAIVGMVLFLQLIMNNLFEYQLAEWSMRLLGAACCVFFGLLNLVSVKSTARFQNTLVIFLLAVLVLFLVWGVPSMSVDRYRPFMPRGWLAMLSTAGLVFISYGGLTTVDNVAEEVRHPGRNLPRGIILAWALISALYVAVVAVAIGVLQGPALRQSPMPISTAAREFSGNWGFAILSLAALAAFLTTANGGILSASRCPMSMSRDHLFPKWMSRLHPRFRAPLYPYLQIATICVYILLLVDMGPVPLSICGLFFLFSMVWYWIYARPRVSRESAVMHIVERVTDQTLRTVTLENELRDILFQRDNITADRFDKLIGQCSILDIKGRISAEEIFRRVSEILSKDLLLDTEQLVLKFLEREEEGSTVIQPGLAIPHIVVRGEKLFDIVLVRAVDGIDFHHADRPVRTVFFLVGSKDERNYHLRALMAIAQVVQEKDFTRRWMEARDTESLRNLILLSRRKREAHE